MERRDVFWLDGVCCSRYGVRLQGPIAFSRPQRRAQTVAIPGRSGALVLEENAFENLSAHAQCFVLTKDRGEAARARAAFARWCFAARGYRRLETPQEPDAFRLARVAEGPCTELVTSVYAPFDLSFDCKPQRFLKSGERVLALTESGLPLYNPGMEAKPLLTVYGTGAGTVTAGGRTVRLETIDGFVTLDCDAQNAYQGTQNKNGTISAPEFPCLPPGESAVTWTGGVQKIEIVPRWWTL